MKEADELCDSIENTIVKKIADDLALAANEIIIFNTDLHDFDGFKEIQVVTEHKNSFPRISGRDDCSRRIYSIS